MRRIGSIDQEVAQLAAVVIVFHVSTVIQTNQVGKIQKNLSFSLTFDVEPVLNSAWMTLQILATCCSL